MEIDLKRFQLKGVRQIQKWGGRGIIADEMGLGKTIQSLWYAHESPELRPMVVVCPAFLKWNWEREIWKCLQLRAYVLEGTKTRRTKILKYHKIVVVNYDILSAWNPYLLEIGPQLLIVDESHYIKNRSAKRSKLVLELARSIPHVICLSGTPLENRPSELWTQLHVVRPKLFPSFFSYAVRYCNTPDAPIWMGDLSFKKLGKIKVGDKVIGWVSDSKETTRKRRCKPENSSRKRRRLVVTEVTGIIKRQAPIVKITMASGRTVKCTADHKWLSTGGGGNHYSKAKIGKHLASAIEITKSIPEDLVRDAGWLGGFCDGEGTWPILAQCPIANPEVCERAEQTMEKLGFDYSKLGKRQQRKGDAKYFIKGGRQEALRFLQWCQPAKKKRIRKHILTSRFITKDKVVKIEPIGEGEVISLTTKTGNYIAWGYCSKNCKPARKPWGWEYKGASHTEELHNKIYHPKTGCVIRRLKKDVLKELPPKQREVILIDIQNKKEYQEAENDFRNWVEKNFGKGRAERAAKSEAVAKMGYLKRLAATLKLSAVLDWVDNYMEGEDKLILFAIHKSIIAQIAERYKNKCVVIDGSTPQKDRKTLVNQFLNSTKVDKLIGQLDAAGMGWSAKGVQSTVHIEWGWNPAEHDQADDRIHGIGRGVEGVVSWSYYFIGKDTIEEKICKAIQEKQLIVEAVLNGKKTKDFDLYDRIIGEYTK